MPDSIEKVRENRLRRMAERQGLRLERARRRDPRALDYGRYRLVAPGDASASYSLTLDAAERALTGEA